MTDQRQEPITHDEPGPPPQRGKRIRNRALVVLAGVVAATLVWVVAVPILGADVSVPKQYGSDEKIDLALGAVIFASLFAGLAGWASLAVLEKITKRRGALIWTVVASIVFLVTLPWQLPGFSTANQLTLALLHIAVAAVLIPALPRAARIG
ncbi:hypothetical protein C5N14_30105 [Micromonospora sp. MW-13]|uniref:DUF6069 family protein n=1 Tax=unclassified Micromonospora TaxID=2617518 RepID=UPI000E449FAF|nr:MULTISPECIES: DUF6069 family protein [unclassified Micromonospora]MCX4469517.1 DUF6069 family protein [Micromonospora sp. NBC_01655]RGC65113.1 hypothetical protein C5N14_30105 [Micromonospora sp. MW-13]